jgi:single-strand DNA-binding protein
MGDCYYETNANMVSPFGTLRNGEKIMGSLNKVQLIGRLGKDPETRRMPSGDAVVNFSIATSEKYKDKTSGELKEVTEWHNITGFGKLAEIMEKYLTKGKEVYIEGSLKTQKWTDANGVEKYKTIIKAEQMLMLGGKTEANTTAPQPTSTPANLADIDDDIPF